jgi:Protein of unknown function (DUF3054)
VRPVRLAVVLDCCCVLAFVIIGRASHAKGETLPGIASTAWPFLAGLASGWLAARAWRRPLALMPAGVGAWLGAVALGMALRVVSGQGTAVAFVFVALAFFGLFLLGWRLVARLVTRGRATLGADRDGGGATATAALRTAASGSLVATSPEGAGDSGGAQASWELRKRSLRGSPMTCTAWIRLGRLP